jgi:peptide/nickel transport system substrate-binding protein
MPSKDRVWCRRGRRLGVLAALLLPLGCADRPADRAAAAASGRGTLVVAVPADLTGVNELLSSSLMDSEVRATMFLHLLEEQPDYQQHPPTFAPSLARSWESSADGLALTFELRDDITWSDGVPVSAEDVRWTWQAQTDPRVAWTYSFAKEEIRDVEVIGPHTVRFHFETSYPRQLLDANLGAILPRHRWSELPLEQWRGNAQWFADHLVVNGPFTLERWDPQQQVVLRRNERFHRPGLPRLERVVLRVIPDEAARIEQLLAGRVHLVEGVPPRRAEEIERHADLELLEVWSRIYSFLAWNTRRPLFAEPEVRRALTLAIDRQALVDTLYRGYAKVGVSPILSTVWAFDRSLEPWPYDPAEARRLLARHGWSDRGDGVLAHDGVPFSFELTTNTGNQLRRDAVVLIQDQLRRVGVEARARLVEFQTLVAMNESHEFDVTLGAWAADTSLDLRYAFHSAEIEGGSNYGGYANTEVDRLIERISREGDPQAALPLFHRLQEILHLEQPYTLLWEPQWLVGISRQVQGARPNALRTFFELEEWHLAGSAGAP